MPVRDLNTLMRSFVHADGAWARCNRCEDADPKAAYWGLFRDDAVILAKAQKHMAKVHAPKAPQGAEAAAELRKPRVEVFCPKPIKKIVSDNCVHGKHAMLEDCSACEALCREADLIEQAAADIQAELEIARR